MKQFRAIVSIAACLIAGVILGWRSFAHSPPARSELSVIEGTVTRVGTGTRRTKFSEAEFPVVYVQDHSEGFRYLDWFPEPTRIYTALGSGDHVRLLSDTTANRWIWELEKDGKIIVSYDEILAAIRTNNRLDPYLAIGLTVIGLVGAFVIVRSFRRRAARANPVGAQRR